MKKSILSTAAILAFTSTANMAHAVTGDFVPRLAISSFELQAVTQQYQAHLLTSIANKPPATPTEVACYQILQSQISDLIHVGTFLINVQNMAFVMTHVSNPAELTYIKPLFLTALFSAKGAADTSLNTYQQVALTSPCQSIMPSTLTQKAVAALTDARKTLDSSGD